MPALAYMLYSQTIGHLVALFHFGGFMRRAVAVSVVLCFVSVLVTSGMRDVRAQDAKGLVLKVLVPQEDAIVTLDKKNTEGTGTERRIEITGKPTGKNKDFYTVTAVWEPNNYTKFTRSRKIKADTKGEIIVDLTKAYDTEKIKIRYVPTPDDVVAKMCQLGKVTKNDTVFDIGCGDGRIVIQAVEKFGAKRGVGIDLDPERIQESKQNAINHKVTDKVTFRVGDALDIKDLSEADVVMLYMGDDVNVRLRPILKKTLKPGSRIVSHRFLMGDWKPARTEAFTGEDGDEYEVHLWVIGKE
jgi:uncharacterized protein (TIGR03000 family)